MLNDQNIKAKLIQEIAEIVDEGLRMHRMKMTQDFRTHMEKISKELWKKIETACYKYESMRQSKLVGNLKWIYISFLRSSFIDRSNCYRIDLYDTDDRISEAECFEMWGFDYIYNGYDNTVKEIEKKVESQTRLKLYEIDPLIKRLREEFRKSSDDAIKCLVEEGMKREGNMLLSQEQEVTIMLGDFLGKAEVVTKVLPKALLVDKRGEKPYG